MKRNSLALSLFLVTAIGIALGASAQAAKKIPEPLLQPIAINTAFVPQGFDSNDRTQIVIEGTIGGTCYKVGPTLVDVDESTQTIYVKQLAYYYYMPCDYIFTSFTSVVDIGILKSGNYKILDQKSGQTLGLLPVKSATTAAPDDYLYAPVNDAQYLPKKRQILLTGYYPNVCMHLKQVVTKMDGNHVVVVLPIAELSDASEQCPHGILPFVQTVDLPPEIKEKERFLLHVRTLNGQAINKVYSAP